MNQSTTELNLLDEEQNAYLIFRLNDSNFAIPVEHVGEIITTIETSPIPGAPDYLEGVVNLRGRILPIVDLRRRFHFPRNIDANRECYIILVLELDTKLIELGIKVDAVSEVVRISSSQVDPANGMHDYHQNLVFTGVAKTESGIKLILDSRILVEQLKNDVNMQYDVKTQSNIDKPISNVELEKSILQSV